MVLFGPKVPAFLLHQSRAVCPAVSPCLTVPCPSAASFHLLPCTPAPPAARSVTQDLHIYSTKQGTQNSN